MVGFESPYPAAIEQVSKTGWKLLDHLVFHGHHETFEIPVGQETDFASTPAVLWAMFPPYGDYTAAAIAHDHFWRVLAPQGRMAYRDADGLLRLMLQVSSVSWLRRWCMWAAVRWGSLITRRGGHKGWFKDAPKVLGMTVVALPFVALPGVVNAVFLILFKLAELIASPLDRRRHQLRALRRQLAAERPADTN